MKPVKGERRARPLHLRINSLVRWLHTYLSMFSLMVVLLFSVTGITLNHPDWTFGTIQKTREVKGQLQREWVAEGTEVQKLEVVEHLRKQHGLRGSLSDFRTDEGECTISFKAPGYAADGFLNRTTGEYQFTVVSDGFVSVMNDLHRGKNSGPVWAWVIDLSSGVLILVSLTGVAMLLYLKKTRTSALWTAAAGLALLAVVIWRVV